MKTLLKAISCVAIFSLFFSCAKEEDIPLVMEDARITNVYALEAVQRSCKDRYFVDHTDTPPSYDVPGWSLSLNMGRLVWHDTENNIAVLAMRFEIKDSTCVEDVKIDIDAETQACLTYTGTTEDADLPLQVAPSGTLPWTTFNRPIYSNSNIQFSKTLQIGDIKPLVPQGADPTKYVPNCTAYGLLKITGVKYNGTDISTGQNVRKNFPFSIIVQ